MKKQSNIAVTMFDQELINLPLDFTNVEIVPLINTPNNEPITLPEPPLNKVPPITADEMASISNPVAWLVVPLMVFKQ